VPLTKPCRLAFFHVGLRFLGREKFTAVKLREGPLDFSVISVLWPPSHSSSECSIRKSPLDDFIRALVGASLHRLGDQFFVLRSKGDGHVLPYASTCVLKYRSSATLLRDARPADNCRISATGSGLKAFASATFRSMNSNLGMPATASVTPSSESG
jgi:hypothetical protein